MRTPPVRDAAPGPGAARPLRWCVVGPTHPFRGGIARHTTLLVDAVAESGIDVRSVSYSRQYPRWLYKGSSDRDPDQLVPRWVTPEHRLDGIGPRSWWTAAGVIAADRPDVLVVVWWHPFLAPALGTLVRRVRRGSPMTTCLALCHNVLPHEHTVSDRRLVRFALAPHDGIVVHSDSEGRAAAELLDDIPVTVSPHPTYLVDLGKTPDAGDRGRPVTLLVFGLVRAYKGVDVLLQALPAVLDQQPVRLVVAGEFWDPIGPYERLIRELDLDDHVDFRPGYVPESELVDLLADADVVVAPYRTATQSGVVEMAFGAGIPVVASDVGGLGDQVEHGVDGLLVPAEDVAALGRALTEAARPDVLGRLTAGAAARTPARTWSQLAHDLETFGSGLAPGRSSGRAGLLRRFLRRRGRTGERHEEPGQPGARDQADDPVERGDRDAQ